MFWIQPAPQHRWHFLSLILYMFHSSYFLSFRNSPNRRGASKAGTMSNIMWQALPSTVLPFAGCNDCPQQENFFKCVLWIMLCSITMLVPGNSESILVLSCAFSSWEVETCRSHCKSWYFQACTIWDTISETQKHLKPSIHHILFSSTLFTTTSTIMYLIAPNLYLISFE